jgi:hypothetical protein
MNRPPPPSLPQRAAPPPAQQRPAAAPASASARAASRVASGTPQAAAVPATSAAGPSPQNLGMDPVATDGSDPRLGFEWRSRAIGSNHTWGCIVSAGEGEAVSVRVSQLPYDRTLRGVGSVEVVAIPVASVGTAGSLTARIEATGAIAQFNWMWRPFEPRHAAARVKTVPSGAAPAQPSLGVAAARAAQQAAAGRVATAVQTPPGAAAGQRAFFGMPAVGRKIAFVLDMSFSMSGARWQKCTQEFAGILSGLDRDCEFFVVLFSDRLAEPPGQAGWTPWDPQRSADVIGWIADFSPMGGTYPRPAFQRLYSMPASPTTVYFLTDGQFIDFTAQDYARIQSSGGSSGDEGLFNKLRDLVFGPREKPPSDKPVVNAITLDDAASAPVMQQLAADSGGQYVHATSA